ncbi:hypothetical protein HZS_1044, partial [Henneguya salminicola]
KRRIGCQPCRKSSNTLMSSISASQKAALASDLLKQAPPGEVREVMSGKLPPLTLDVRTILRNDELLREACLSAIEQYNEKMFTPVKVVKGSDSLITVYAKTDGQYIDNRNKIKFVFDHIKKEVTSTSKHALNDLHQSYADPIDIELCKYTTDHYKNGNSAIYISGEEEDLKIIICLESHAYSPSNFWNGVLLSEYKIDLKDRKVDSHITSKIHYYEDGNVQLHSNKESTMAIKEFKGPKELATSLLTLLDKEESKYQEALVDDIRNMMETTFKALRRQLPFTQSKIDWNKIGAYGLAQELTK